MKKTLLFLTAASCLLATSCKKTADPTPEPTPGPEVQNPIPLSISLPITKVTDSAYEASDQVGLYVVNAGSTLAPSGNHATNEAFTFNGSVWKSATQLYWKDSSTSASFYCYYPRMGSIADVSAVPFSVKTDQSTLAGYKSSELLWGSRKNIAPTSDAVEITTTHRMSKLLVYLRPGEGYSAESLQNETIALTINSLKPGASIDLASGTVSATGNPADITPYRENDHFKALVPPQSLSGQTLISLKAGDYSFSHQETITLKSNTQHTVTLTVNKVSEGISIGIGQWETDDQDYGGTVN